MLTVFSDANGIKALGFFGGIHYDKSDSAGGYTTLLANSDLPEGWEGGRFHLIEFGLYVELDGITASTFTGLRLHGGTPPLAPAGAEIPPWAYRWVVVLYPQGATLDGRVNMNLCTQTDGTLVQLTPEIKGLTASKPAVEEYVFVFTLFRFYILISSPGTVRVMKIRRKFSSKHSQKKSNIETDSFDVRLSTNGNEINFVEDGHLLMTPQAEINFLARAFYQILLSQRAKVCGQIPISFDDYRRMWSFERNGIQYSAGPWPLAPDGTPWVEPAANTGELTAATSVYTP